MPDSRFFTFEAPISLADAARIVGATPGDLSGEIGAVAAPDEPDLNSAVVYCVSEKSAAALAQKQFGLCLTTEEYAQNLKDGTCWVLPSPKLAFAKLAGRLHTSREEAGTVAAAPPRISKTADVHSTAVIGAGAEIAEGVRIGPGSYIGRGVEIGRGAVVEAGATITHALIGEGVHVLPGARIGQAGFGFIESQSGLVRMPQLGRVVIESAVEIGANTTIDRGALSDTVIGEGSKIDNLVQIGHNVR
ncbi:MAG: UDP-3-O-(3-hydroxymyristoyl)glucosamine N-acyltransferase, partial [Hyphococcus sp.]